MMTGSGIVVDAFVWLDKNTREAFDNVALYPDNQADKIQTKWVELQNEQRAGWIDEPKWLTWESLLRELFERAV